MVRFPTWLTSVAVTGTTALLLASRVFWLLISAPASLAESSSSLAATAIGRWLWHVLQLVAAWM